MQTIADLRGLSPLIALQIEYSVVERTVERDLIPMPPSRGSVRSCDRHWQADLDPGDGSGEISGTRRKSPRRRAC